ncbi:class I SAM-dependent methyltransferase [Celeribacter marinus]|uniref:class I SAM-dependent methyltransferase n=1 Tax=Celeribacter marinus TaxID=1397108 RepID=UPI00317DE377
MITLDMAIDKTSTPRIAQLDTSAFAPSDVLNLILQRSEIIRDQDNYNSYIQAWIRGETVPLEALVAQIGQDTLIRRAAAFILFEYEELFPIIAANPPLAVTDIGCGYAFFDLFLAQDFDCNLTLIDLEHTNERHFGFQQTGAGYSSLAVAAASLGLNGLDPDRIQTLNPERRSIADIRDQDLVVSLISCGFHYPWTTYETFFKDSVKPDGKIILDVRRRTLSETLSGMASLGDVVDLDAGASPKAARIAVTRGPHTA